MTHIVRFAARSAPPGRYCALGHHHGAGVTQRGHFDMILGVSGQVTAGAPEGPYRRRRVLRTMCG